MVPNESLDRLLEGNARFMAGVSNHSFPQEALNNELLNGQRPFATVFGCSDSRVPVELVFDQSFGDLFVIRNAGHIVGESVLGSMEFAVTQIACPLIVVLGHSQCGAATAALNAWKTKEYPPGHIVSIVRAIEPVLGHADVSDVNGVVRAHVVDTTRQIYEGSEIIAERVRAGELWLVAAKYELAARRVSVLRVFDREAARTCGRLRRS
jgi:carbonic anhydrase